MAPELRCAELSRVAAEAVEMRRQSDPVIVQLKYFMVSSPEQPQERATALLFRGSPHIRRRLRPAALFCVVGPGPPCELTARRGGAGGEAEAD